MTRRGWLWSIGVATGAIGLVLMALEQPMWDAGGPGIIGFELAGSEERADRILREWDEEARDAARVSLIVDFLYLAGYGAFWSLAAQAVGRSAAAIAAPAAAFWDALENVALLLVLGRNAIEVAAPVAAVAATIKFALIGYSVAAVLLTLANRHRRITAALLTLGLALSAVVVITEELRTEEGQDPFLKQEGTGEPLVLIHGYTVDHRWWGPIVPALRRHQRVIRVDLRGHGRSEKPREGYSMEEQADLVARGLRRAGASGAPVVGHSMGGAVAVALAERHPQLVSRLMLIGTGPEVGQYDGGVNALTPAFLPISGHLIRALAPDDWIRWAFEQGLRPEIDITDAQAEAADRTTWRAFSESAKALGDYTEKAPLDVRLRRLKKPYRAVFGSDDEAGELAGRFDGVEKLDGLGHSPFLERPDLVAELIEDFVLDP